MKVRILASAMLLPFLASIYFGGYFLLGITLFCMIVGLNELFNGLKSAGINPSKWIGFTMLSLLVIYETLLKNSFEIIFIFVIVTLILSLIYNLKVEERKLIDSISTFFGTIYVGLLFLTLVLIDKSSMRVCNWYVVIIAFGTDIFAYFTGFFIGKHKLCEKLSPKKTIEGAIGGLVGSVILTLIFNYFLTRYPFYYILILGLIGSVMSQLGDLAASSIKRQIGIKDYGKLIPGHGGILDRFDSILFVAPIVYLFIYIFS